MSTEFPSVLSFLAQLHEFAGRFQNLVPVQQGKENQEERALFGKEGAQKSEEGDDSHGGRVRVANIEGCGLGLVTSEDVEEGQVLFEDHPMPGLCILFDDEEQVAVRRRTENVDHCLHCLRSLVSASSSSCECPRDCGASFCSEMCFLEADLLYHWLLCAQKKGRKTKKKRGKSVKTENKFDLFLKKAKEYSNEYYVLAARMMAMSLLPFHPSQKGRVWRVDLGTEEGWWRAARYHGPPWWETMDPALAGERRQGADKGGEDEQRWRQRIKEQTGEMRRRLLDVFRSKIPGQFHEQLSFFCSEKRFAECCGVIRCNATSVEICAPLNAGLKVEQMKGMALFPLQSLMNHSTFPNSSCCALRATQCGDGKNPGSIEVRALRKLKKGEEVRFDYIRPDLSMEERKRLLKTQYGIEELHHPGIESGIEGGGSED